MALTGHKGEAPKDGIFSSLIVSLVCNVLLHLIKKWMPGVAKNTSEYLCSIAEKLLIECGTRFDILRNEKNAVRYNALKICPIHIVSQILIMESNNGISIIFSLLVKNSYEVRVISENRKF